ncbi:MAG: aminopeptidase [Traorella sp.]
MSLLEKKHQYAYLLAKAGLNVQKGQTVLVEACVEGYEFASIFAEECYKIGAGNVVIHYLDMANLKIASQYRDLEEIKKVNDWEVMQCQPYLDDGACYVRLEGVDPSLMEDVSEECSSAIFAHVDAVRNIMRKASRDYHCQWLIAMIPTAKWATYILDEKDETKALNQLWEIMFELCHINEKDPVEKWHQLMKEKAQKGKMIDDLHLQKLHYTASNGTDLIVELDPESKFYDDFGPSKIPFIANLPTEEIYTTPYKYGTEGIVYASKPLVLGGKKIENFGFRFEKGKVVEVIANEGKEMLENLIHMDENAAYLGECALVEYHSPISMSNLVYYTTLIDENASCHLALGRGLNNSNDLNKFNQSIIHVDFMIGTKDLDIVGIDDKGHEVQIFKNGDFAI